MIGTSDCRLVISGKSLFVRNRIGCDGGRREGRRSGFCLESCTSSTPEKDVPLYTAVKRTAASTLC